MGHHRRAGRHSGIVKLITDVFYAPFKSNQLANNVNSSDTKKNMFHSTVGSGGQTGCNCHRWNMKQLMVGDVIMHQICRQTMSGRCSNIDGEVCAACPWIPPGCHIWHVEMCGLWPDPDWSGSQRPARRLEFDQGHTSIVVLDAASFWLPTTSVRSGRDHCFPCVQSNFRLKCDGHFRLVAMNFWHNLWDLIQDMLYWELVGGFELAWVPL